MKRLKKDGKTRSFTTRASTDALTQRKMIKAKPRATIASSSSSSSSSSSFSSSSSPSSSNPSPFVCNFTGTGLLPSAPPPPPSPWSSFLFSTPSSIPTTSTSVPAISSLPVHFSFGNTRLTPAGDEQRLQMAGMFPTTSPLFFISSARRDVADDSEDEDSEDESDSDNDNYNDDDDDDNDDSGNDNNGVDNNNVNSDVVVTTAGVFPRATEEQMARRMVFRAHRPGSAAAVARATRAAAVAAASAAAAAAAASVPSSSSSRFVVHRPRPNVAISVTITSSSRTAAPTSTSTSTSSSSLGTSSRDLIRPATSAASATAAVSTTGSTQLDKVEQEMVELRMKVRALEQAEQQQKERACVICMENPKNVVLSPCNHLCICQDCSSRVVLTCPICRSAIKKKTVVYL